MADSIPLAFAKIVELAKRDDVQGINQLDGCWERGFGEWWLALNGHEETTKCSRDYDVPPYSAAVFHGDWIAAVLDLGGGVFVGDGENEFIEAIEQELDSANAR